MAEPESGEPATEREELKSDETGNGTEPGAEPGAGDGEGDRENPVMDEWIEIDFFINVLLEGAEDKVAEVFAQTCGVKMEQITNVQVRPSDTRTRISLKIVTDAWEMSTLSQTVTNLVPQKTLSQCLLDTLELEKRPRVGQFYSKSSTQDIPTIDQPDKYPYDSEDRKRLSRSSLPKAKDEEKGDTHSAARTSEGGASEPPQSSGCGCNIM